MDKTDCKKKILTAFGILFSIGTILIGANGLLELGCGQTNSTSNQTSASNPTTNTTTATITTPTQTNSTSNQTSTTSTSNNTSTTPAQERAADSIKGAITETGEFLGNVSQKVTTSKSAGALLNETSDALGNAYVETQKFFKPN